jgi:hypothetical protein
MADRRIEKSRMTDEGGKNPWKAFRRYETCASPSVAASQ